MFGKKQQEPKLCIDCKYYDRGYGVFDNCYHPNNIKFNGQTLVTGAKEKPSTHWMPFTLRSKGGFDMYLLTLCGKKGRWFVPIVKEETK
jgi:hypothetical protein